MLNEFIGLLITTILCILKANSQWRKVKDRLEADQRCSRLDTMDQLKIFQVSFLADYWCLVLSKCSFSVGANLRIWLKEYVGDLEKDEEEQKRIQKVPVPQYFASSSILFLLFMSLHKLVISSIFLNIKKAGAYSMSSIFLKSSNTSSPSVLCAKIVIIIGY